MVGGKWWTFDRPLWKDPLFIVGVLLGIAAVVGRVLAHDPLGVVLYMLVVGVPCAIYAVGVVLGSVREYARARRRRSA